MRAVGRALPVKRRGPHGALRLCAPHLREFHLMPVVTNGAISLRSMPWRAAPHVPEFLQGGTRCRQRVGGCGSAAWFFPLTTNSCAWPRTSIVLRTRRSTLIGAPASLLSNAATPRWRRPRKSRRDSTFSWRPSVAVVFVGCEFEYPRACPASHLGKGVTIACPAIAMRRREVMGERPQRQTGSSYPSPSPSPLQRERRPKDANQRTLPRWGSRTTVVLSRRATRQLPGTFVRNSAYCQRKARCRKSEESASSPLGVSQSSTWPSSRTGQSRPGLASQK